MNRHRQLPIWTGAILGTACALFVFTLGAHAADHHGANVTEEFHQTYAISADGRIELDNINGDVHISSWDQSQVKVDAVKYADNKEELDDAKIEIDSGKEYLSIRTKYREHQHWNHNSAGVEYTLTVPRNVRLDEIKLINGELDIAGVSGEVQASCINGRLEAHNLAGRAKLSTINGKLDARFDQLAGSSVELNSVNGEVELTIPSDSKAEIEASTVSGSIRNDFGLHEKRHQWVGHELRGELGGGGTSIHLSNVNGRIQIQHAEDGRSLSPVKDRNSHDGDDSEI
jgi:DUF4097 and DUF4098 domain-containing protein YvlB